MYVAHVVLLPERWCLAVKSVCSLFPILRPQIQNLLDLAWQSDLALMQTQECGEISHRPLVPSVLGSLFELQSVWEREEN